MLLYNKYDKINIFRNFLKNILKYFERKIEKEVLFKKKLRIIKIDKKNPKKKIDIFL